MSKENTGPGEVPIIVQGGGSVGLDLPTEFEEENNPGKKGGKFKNRNQDVLRIEVDGKPVQVEVKKNSKIVIWCGTRND